MYDVILEDGPLDGLLGFSHGTTFAMMWLLQHAVKNPMDALWSIVGCVVFIAGPSPFGEDGERLRNPDAGVKLRIPTVHIVGKGDELYEDALKMYSLCEEGGRVLVEHEKGHVIPRDEETVRRMTKTIKDLRGKMVSI